MTFTPAVFTPNDVATQCRLFGGQVGPLPDDVDGTQLLWAMSGVESSFGKNLTPRHEPAFDKGGMYATHAPMPALLAKYGSLAACSFGPLQLLLCNAPFLAPDNFNDISDAFRVSVLFLNSKLRAWHPVNLAQIGECWNHGSIAPDPDYEQKLAKAYLVPMPDAAMESA